MALTRQRPRAPKGTRPHGGRRAGAGKWGSGFLQCTVCQHEERGRIDYLAASGASLRSLEAQFGVRHASLQRHFERHGTERFKRLCQAQHLTSFAEMLQNATEANAETVDTINLLIRGQAQRWAICLQVGADQNMNFHARRILQAIELRSRIALELQPEARNLTINNFIRTRPSSSTRCGTIPRRSPRSKNGIARA